MESGKGDGKSRLDNGYPISFIVGKALCVSLRREISGRTCDCAFADWNCESQRQWKRAGWLFLICLHLDGGVSVWARACERK